LAGEEKEQTRSRFSLGASATSPFFLAPDGLSIPALRTPLRTTLAHTGPFVTIVTINPLVSFLTDLLILIQAGWRREEREGEREREGGRGGGGGWVVALVAAAASRAEGNCMGKRGWGVRLEEAGGSHLE